MDNILYYKKYLKYKTKYLKIINGGSDAESDTDGTDLQFSTPHHNLHRDPTRNLACAINNKRDDPKPSMTILDKKLINPKNPTISTSYSVITVVNNYEYCNNNLKIIITNVEIIFNSNNNNLSICVNFQITYTHQEQEQEHPEVTTPYEYKFIITFDKTHSRIILCKCVEGAMHDYYINDTFTDDIKYKIFWFIMSFIIDFLNNEKQTIFPIDSNPTNNYKINWEILHLILKNYFVIVFNSYCDYYTRLYNKYDSAPESHKEPPSDHNWINIAQIVKIDDTTKKSILVKQPQLNDLPILRCDHHDSISSYTDIVPFIEMPYTEFPPEIWPSFDTHIKSIVKQVVIS